MNKKNTITKPMENKLYTEEQIRQNLNNMGYFVDEQIEDFINNLKPIEIPSVEKIEEVSYLVNRNFELGAKWMRNEIQEQVEKNNL